MKNLYNHICTTSIAILFFIGCVAATKSQPMHFTEMTLSKCKFKMDNINIQFITFLDNEKILVVGNSLYKSEIDISQKLFIIDTASRKILFESESEEMPYGGSLYSVTINNNKFVLWEKKNEYASVLQLFAYKNKFIYVGNFEVTLDVENKLSDDFSYPVKGIDITESDNVIQFKFVKKAILNTDKELNIKKESQLIYELDINNNKLKIK